MIFLATPYTMTQDFFLDSMGRGDVGTASDYTTRQTIEVEGSNPREAAEQTWATYQNLSNSHGTPDKGRSMMIGDLVRLQDRDTRKVFWMRVETKGFQMIRPPAKA